MKRFYTALLRAQACSDAGKGIYNPTHNAVKCYEQDYSLKDFYIKEAIANIPSNCFFYIDYTESLIIYFETPYGQVSFHSFGDYKESLSDSSQFTRIRWNEKLSGSKRTCKRIERKFNLQVF